ncbi:MAG: hypothetical protein WBA81_06900 [Rhodococcus sp. (in: high G+C Gram-positive bacteria)]|uniref:hypothetical protein n=1 Tax=Rhodococcus sp. EPR-157 TaxID=1813677 RepID=UPI0007BAEFC0|nr:hypothetical protein [Rhodococcus sp. EPR-157]KZF09306.1 hypothetical protein A2J03_02820 [Rhodococcus sp. EPR-157]
MQWKTVLMEPHPSIDDLLEHCHAHNLDADLGTMFRSPALRCRGKVFAFVGFDGALIVKLPHARIVQLASQGTAEQVTMGKRTMREWAEIALLSSPRSTADLWFGLVEEAHKFVSSQPGK